MEKPADVRAEMRLAVIEAMVGRLYMLEYRRAGLSLDEVRRLHRAMIKNAGQEVWPTDHPAQSDLYAGEAQDALAALLSLIETQVKEAIEKGL
jgi:hypothetical protein